MTDLDYSDGSESPPDYEEVADVQKEMIFNIHTDTLYSKTSSNSSLELSSDPVTKAKILQSTVFCIHREEGCMWAGPLGRLKGHLNVCQKDATLCMNKCGAKIARVSMEDHVKYTCSMRRINCVYCKQSFTGDSVEEHQTICGFEPLYCENKCGLKVARNRLKAHMVNNCSKRLVNCKYCGRSFSRSSLSPWAATGSASASAAKAGSVRKRVVRWRAMSGSGRSATIRVGARGGPRMQRIQAPERCPHRRDRPSWVGSP